MPASASSVQTQSRPQPGAGARGLLIVGDRARDLREAMGPHLPGWELLSGPTDPPRLAKLTILSDEPEATAERRARLGELGRWALESPRVAAVEVIAEWGEDSAYAQGGRPDAPVELAPLLAAIARRGGPRVVARGGGPPSLSRSELITPLVMIGVSVEGRLGRGLGQALPHVTPEELAAIKLPQRGVYDLLRALSQEAGVRECLVWNTCARMELYAWVDSDKGVVGRLRRRLFPSEGRSTHVASLRAHDAWLHMLRTAVGLNSTMPGDGEVVEQLQAAHRMAVYTGAAGERAEALLGQVDDCVRTVRERTAWGAYMREYTHTALDRALAAPPRAGQRCLVIGGSTTSVSALRYLVGHGVAPADITMAYRGEGRRRLVQRVRQVGGESLRRLRLGSYESGELGEAARAAELIVIGVDRREAVLSGEMVGVRDGGRPLVVVDFNTHGSTRGLAGVAGVELIGDAQLSAAVEAVSRESLADPSFHAAAIEGERVVAERVALGV